MKTRSNRNISTVQLSERLVRSRARFMPAAGANLPASPRPELRLGQQRHQPVQQKILVSFVAGALEVNPSICFPGLFRRGLLGLLALVLGSVLLGVTPARAQTQCPEATVKFDQPPLLDGGFDVWDSGPWVLADDFICTNTGPITDIHLWGSWLNDAYDPNTTFWLGLYDDVPAITNGPAIIPSHPGTNLIWQQWFGPGQYLQNFFSGDAGQMIDPGPPALIGGESKAYYYCFYPTNPPIQQGTGAKPMMYWLAVYAQPSQGTASFFGWKSSTLQQYDISVHTQWPGGPPPATANWVPTRAPNNQPLDLAFKIVTSPNPPPPPCCPETNGVKWLQPPDVLHGMDVNASQNLVLADDFPCTTTGPVKDIRIWGSWLGDKVDANVVFTLGIWSDVPAVTNAANYVPSHPGVLLWTQPFGQGEYGQCLYTNVNEPFYDASLPAILGGDFTIYYLCFNPTNAFVQQGTASAPTNYWLSVNARTTAGAGLVFGWHNSSLYYNDTAVWGNAPAPAAWNPMYDPAGIPLSMAFKVTTTTNQCPMTVTCAADRSVQCGEPWVFTPPTVNSPC
ncbi:MAG TPA: hypothetical protein VN578_14050, partial [Candidatus Binatia bacterium]|nr:hypothetical protein [Candidatus Binatia bacterium]